MLAAKNDHPKVVKFLLDKGADIKVVDMVSYRLRYMSLTILVGIIVGARYHARLKLINKIGLPTNQLSIINQNEFE